MDRDSELKGEEEVRPSFRLGFWRRHFSSGLWIGGAALFSLVIFPLAVKHDSREELLKVDGHITGLRYSPGAGPGGSGRIEFGFEEISGQRFRVEKLHEADELLFMTREKTESYIHVWVESEKWKAPTRANPLLIVGLESSRGTYLAPPDVGAELSLDRIGARLFLALLLGTIGYFGFRLRTAHQAEVKADPKSLEAVVDPVLAWVSSLPPFNRIEWALLADARRVEAAEDARKKSSRATVEKASNKPMRAVEMLIRSGANLNAHNPKGETPLVLAVKAGSQEAVQVLLQHHADPNLADAEGWTALMHAADQGELGICKRLLESGALVEAKRKDGKTAMDLAEASQKKNPALIEALRRAMTLNQVAERAKGSGA